MLRWVCLTYKTILFQAYVVVLLEPAFALGLWITVILLVKGCIYFTCSIAERFTSVLIAFLGCFFGDFTLSKKVMEHKSLLMNFRYPRNLRIEMKTRVQHAKQHTKTLTGSKSD